MIEHNKQRRYKSKGRRCRIALVFSFVYFISGCGFAVNSGEVEQTTQLQEEVSVTSVSGDGTDNSLATTQAERIYVHVCGAVKHSGVYQLPADARVVDAVQAAGGFTKKADEQQLNQAQPLTDGQQLYVPRRDEKKNSQGTETSSEVEDGRVNLNQATAEELMTLPGIGASKAQAILDYREEHGGFRDISELKQISGIKDGTFNKIKDNITVG